MTNTNKTAAANLLAAAKAFGETARILVTLPDGSKGWASCFDLLSGAMEIGVRQAKADGNTRVLWWSRSQLTAA